MCVLHHPFSKSGHFFAISTKRVTVAVPVSKFTLFLLNIKKDANGTPDRFRNFIEKSRWED